MVHRSAGRACICPRGGGELRTSITVLRVCTSNHLWVLARDLAHAWRQPGPDRDVVMVQSTFLANWLRRWLARDWGVCADLDLVLPGQWLQRMGASDDQAWRRDALRWRLATVVDPSELPGDPLARHRVLMQLADAFDTWQLHRSDTLAAWAQGRFEGDSAWLATAWQRLVNDNSDQPAPPHQHAYIRSLITALNNGTAQVPPGRFGAFAITHVPMVMLDLFAALGRQCDFTLWLWSPSAQPWTDHPDARSLAASRRQRLAAALRSPQRKSAINPAAIPEPSHQPDENVARIVAEGHPLVVALGGHIRRWFHALDGPELIQAWESLPFVIPERDSILHRLQADVVEGPESPAAQPLTADDSLTVHRVTSERRELEVLREHIARAIDAGIPCSEILVLVSDLPRYAPLIAMVFSRPVAVSGNATAVSAGVSAVSGNAAAASGDEAEEITAQLPWCLADRSISDSDPLAATLLRVLALAGSRLPRSAIYDLLRQSVITTATGCNPAQIEQVINELDRAGVRWGADAQAVAQIVDEAPAPSGWNVAASPSPAALNVPTSLAYGTWRGALDRLRAGWWLGPDDQAADLPVAGALGGDRAAQQQILSWIDRLLALLAAAQAVRTPSAWLVWTEQLIGQLLLPLADERESWPPRSDAAISAAESAVELRQVLAEIRLCTAVVSELIPMTVWRDVLTRAINEAESPRPLGAPGGITFAGLKPLRTIPARFIALIGMDDASLPRRHQPPAWDPFASLPLRPGERDPRQEDRALFLEAVLAAGERLHVSWVARDPRTDQSRPPSVCVSALLDALDAMQKNNASADPAGAALAAGERLSSTLTFDHPRHGAGETCDPLQAAINAERFTAQMGAIQDLPALRSASEITGNSHKQLAKFSLAELGKILADPTAAYARHHLGLLPEFASTAGADDQPLTADALMEWQWRDAHVRAALNLRAPVRRDRAVADGLLPPQHLGDDPWRRAHAEGQELAARIRRAGPSAQARHLQVTTAAGQLNGTLQFSRAATAQTQQVIGWTVSKRDERCLLQAWLASVLASAAQPEPIAVVWLASDDQLWLPPLKQAQALAICERLIALTQRCQQHCVPFTLAASWALHASADLGTTVEKFAPKEREDAALQRIWRGHVPVEDPGFADAVAQLWTDAPAAFLRNRDDAVGPDS